MNPTCKDFLQVRMERNKKVIFVYLYKDATVAKNAAAQI